MDLVRSLLEDASKSPDCRRPSLEHARSVPNWIMSWGRRASRSGRRCRLSRSGTHRRCASRSGSHRRRDSGLGNRRCRASGSRSCRQSTSGSRNCCRRRARPGVHRHHALPWNRRPSHAPGWAPSLVQRGGTSKTEP